MDYKEFEELKLSVGDLVAVTYVRYGRISHKGNWGKYNNLAVGLFCSAMKEDDPHGRYPVLTLCSIIQRGNEVIIPMHTVVGDVIHPELPCNWGDIKSVQRLGTKEELESMLESTPST
jgi:hypothetical protein